MSNWRDDLPEIPGERILRAAIDERYRRREARRQRLQVVMYSGLGVGAIALLIGIGALFSTGGDDNDDGGAADTAPAETLTAGTDAPAITEGAGTTAAPATSASPGTTTGAPGTTASPGTTTSGTAPGTTGATATTSPAAATTIPDYTTVIRPPPSDEVTVTQTVIWESPESGPDCGPTTLTVVFAPPTESQQTPVVHWETAGVQDEAAMDVDDETARATIGPFPAETLGAGTNHELLVYVTHTDAAGAENFYAPTVILRDCSQ